MEERDTWDDRKDGERHIGRDRREEGNEREERDEEGCAGRVVTLPHSFVNLSELRITLHTEELLLFPPPPSTALLFLSLSFFLQMWEHFPFVFYVSLAFSLSLCIFFFCLLVDLCLRCFIYLFSSIFIYLCNQLVTSMSVGIYLYINMLTSIFLLYILWDSSSLPQHRFFIQSISIHPTKSASASLIVTLHLKGFQYLSLPHTLIIIPATHKFRRVSPSGLSVLWTSGTQGAATFVIKMCPGSLSPGI